MIFVVCGISTAVGVADASLAVFPLRVTVEIIVFVLVVVSLGATTVVVLVDTNPVLVVVTLDVITIVSVSVSVVVERSISTCVYVMESVIVVGWTDVDVRTIVRVVVKVTYCVPA